MKCYQCERPAMYRMGDQAIPLCLHCFRLASDISNIEFLKAAAMSNQALDDMDAIIPVGPTTGKIPVAELARAMQKGSTYSHIQIANSQVGLVNTGDIEKIEAAITLAQGSDAETVGQQLKLLTEAILASAEIDQETRQELVQLIQALSGEVIRERKKPVAKALLDSIREKTSGVVELAKQAGDLAEAIKQIFGGWS